MQYFWMVLFGLGSFFLWATIHELSHAVAARWKLGAREFQFKLYPHFLENGRFVFASVAWQLPGQSQGLPGRPGVCLAPRVLDLLGVVLFPLSAPVDFLEWHQIALAALAAGGVVDLFVGSIGWSPDSDLRQAAKLAGAEPNVLRVPGLMLVVVSVGWWACLQFG
jgi:hypothetical protein